MKRAIVAVLALAAGACAGGRAERGMDTVSESDYGRLQPNQARMVDDARQEEMQARDELARAQLRLTDTQHEDELAKAEQSSADSDKKRAEAEAKIGAESNEPNQKLRAQQLSEAAELHRRTADAHLDWAKKLIDARKAEVDAARKRVDLMAAKVNLAKLQALQDAQIPAAGKYDLGAISDKVNKAEHAHNDAQAKARNKDGEATAAQQRWQDLNRQMQARLGTLNRG